MSNLVPQTNATNNGIWKKFEDYTRRFVGGANNREVYVVAGTYGSKSVELTAEGTQGTNPDLNQSSVKIPEYLWKVILVLNQPGLDTQDVNATNAYTIGLWMPNGADGSGKIDGKQPDGTYKYLRSVDFIESQTSYDFFSYLPDGVQAAIEANTDYKKAANIFNGAALLSENTWDNPQVIDVSSRGTDISSNTAIWHDSVTANGFFEINGSNYIGKISSSQVGIEKVTVPQLGTSKVRTDGGNIIEINLSSTSTSQIGTIEVGSSQVSRFNGNTSQVGSSQVSTNQFTTNQLGFFKNSPSEVGANKAVATQFGSSEVSSTQIDSTKKSVITHIQLQPSKVSLPSSIPSQQFFSTNVVHENTSNLLTNIYSTAQSIWQSIPVDLTFEVTNLPKGQLAEATITGYDTNGRPNAATISIDDDANGVGWFIDTTPQDNSEFQGTGSYFTADPNSPASGKYDLLTAILHEMGHTLGFINGYSQFNQQVKGNQFLTGTQAYTLSSDLSHLDNTLYPNDLLNTNLKPGIRKLPSTMDWAIINTISGSGGVGVLGSTGVNPAHLTAGALLAISNGDFTTNTGWNTSGATNIINGTATLTEQSQKLAELTQAFTIPTGAKRLQFTILDNHLIPGDTTKTANDAFEVALLDTTTYNPLAGTSQGLNHTDSLLNIQANGTVFKSDKVTITTLNNKQIVSIDVSSIAPNTNATLYFNLLGFGAKTSTVTIDDVKLFTDSQPIPVATNDILTTNQGTPLSFNPTINDTNVNQIQIITQPTHGTLNPPLPLPGGEFSYTYTPEASYVGTDTFTYIGYDSNGQISNLATVNLTINNLPPTIESLLIPTQINEGQIIQLSALAKDGGSSDNLTYTWNFGDDTALAIERNTTHTFADNGNYNIVLTVTDKDGGITSQTTIVKVDNVAPSIVNITKPTTIKEGERVTFTANVTDPGIKDTLTYSWNFGDGTALVIDRDATHTFADNGNYNVVLTVTDKDGGVTSQTVAVKVDNVAPIIGSIAKPSIIKEGESVQFSATATDAGINDSIGYSWNFGDNTNPVIGQNINHTFADNGNYNVTLTVTDKDGAATTQTVVAKVDNVAPTIVNIIKPTTIPSTLTITSVKHSKTKG